MEWRTARYEFSHQEQPAGSAGVVEVGGGGVEEGRETEARMNAWRRDTVTQLYPYPFSGWVTVSLLQTFILASVSLPSSTWPPPTSAIPALCVPVSQEIG